MLQPRARWHIQEAAPETVEALARELGVDHLLARLLTVRGISGVEQAERFLHKEKASFHDPYLMDGMDHAVRRIRSAVDRGEKIRIYGDYDADGVSSTSLMIYVMRQLQANFDYYIPHRVHEGYGLNRSALDHAKRSGVSLIVTVDTGISAREEIAYASEIGLDVVVTDHHEPPEQLPEAYAILNPKKPGCPYPFKQLAGVGVAFKLAHALFGEPPEQLLEMAAIGTVADLMPLIDENRQIVRIGIERMRRTSFVGIKALLGLAGVENRDLNATHIGFALAPRINASGRLDCADDAVKLLTTASEQEAEHLAYTLDALNKERQRIVEEISQEALVMAAGIEQRKPRVLVLAKEEWNVGVIGIVASKMMDRFYCPAIVLSIDPDTGMAKGSARSIAGFDMYKALTRCSELLDHYGGHQAAAGMSLHQDHIPEFRERLESLAEEWLTDEDYIPMLQADLICSLDEVPLETIKQLDMLAPFGMGNPAPRFVFSSLRIGEMRTMGKEQQHIKLSLSGGQQETAASIEAVGFGRGAWMQQISATASVDVLGELSVNEWNGVRKPQIVVHDLRVPEPQLFDWRGTADAEKRWVTLTDRFTADRHDQAGRPSVVLFEENEAGRLPSSIASCGCSVWRFDPKTGFIPIHKDEPDNVSDSRDFLFYSLPPSLHTLEMALSAIPGAQRLYAKFQSPDSQQSAVPTRDMFKYAYTAMKQQGSLDVGNDKMLEAFSRRSGLSKTSVAFIMEVFAELEFTVREGNVYRCLTTPARRELTSSDAYQAGLLRQEAERLLIYSSAAELTSWMLGKLAVVSFTNGG